MAAAKGNNYAAKDRQWGAMLRRALKDGDGDRLRRIAETVLTKAEQGESWAIQEIANRLDGKPVQQIEHSGEFTQRLATEYSNQELALIAAGIDPSASATNESIN